MKNEINTKTARAKLAPRREPYWQRISTGNYIGYRPSKTGIDGTWIVRHMDEHKNQKFMSLGNRESFDVAMKAANEWLTKIKSTGHRESLTVAQACKAYVRNLESTNRDSTAEDAEGRFSAFVYGTKLGIRATDTLKATHIKEWRDGMKGKASTVNRNLTQLKAALNYCYKQQLIESDRSWKGVERVKIQDGETESRDRWLTQAERKSIIGACDPDLALLVKALLMTGARPGELTSCKVSDFYATNAFLKLAKSKTDTRSISLSSSVLAVCKEAAKDKLPGALLFTRADGKKWTKRNWGRPFRRAVEAAKIDNPEKVTLYCLRHTFISETISSNLLSGAEVAKYTGTSTKQIDDHYLHLCHNRTSTKLDMMNMI
jgi:integrase